MDQQHTPDFLAGRGEMAALIRTKDWSETPLGAFENWPQSLRTTVSLCLASNFPIDIVWGPGHTQIYNDGYRIVCGDSHPAALGQDYSVTWASAWPAIGEPFARALAGETTFLENQRMFLTRNGYLEETFFTFSTSPIRDESGGIGGLFHPVTETTATMLAERRTRALRDLTAALTDAASITDLAERVIGILAGFDLDLPFVLLYALSPDGAQYRLAAQHGLQPGTSASPAALAVDAAAPWPIARAVTSAQLVELPDAGSVLQGVACGPYDEPPNHAFVIPVSVPGVSPPPLVAVIGASPRLPLNDAYRGFYELLAAAFAAALASVRAREDERRRAEALAELDRAKTTFFSNVSHEFRTPLTLMLGPLEESLARAEQLPADERERVALAHRNGLRLLKLVNSLLDFSRIEAGRALVAFEPVDLAAFTAELASNFRSACERAGLALVIDAPPLPGPVYVDRDMWEKVVLNLLSNAFKFTFKGTITVRVRASAGAGTAEVTVADTGIGIPGQELPRLFERFHRVAGANGRSYEGSGIGLALVRELVALHGGTIDVESEMGQGSSFTVSIPFTHDVRPVAAEQTQALTSTATREPARKRAAQPVHQRARRHARWRAADRRDGEQVARWPDWARAGPAAGSILLALHHRYRDRDDAGGDRARL